jgi:hypothetical protein
VGFGVRLAGILVEVLPLLLLLPPLLMLLRRLLLLWCSVL